MYIQRGNVLFQGLQSTSYMFHLMLIEGCSISLENISAREFLQTLQFFIRIDPDPPTRPDPPPPLPNFFEFSQKLQFFVHIHPDPTTRPPPPPDFFFDFTKTSLLRSHPSSPPPPPPPPNLFFCFHKNFNSSFTSTLSPQI